MESAGRLGQRGQVVSQEPAHPPPALSPVEGPAPGPVAGFRYYLRVRYVECDAQKVVFNSRYGEYVDVAINEFIRAIGWLPAFVEGGLDFQLVKQTIEWKAPGRFDQVLELSIAPFRLGTTSFTVGTTFRIAGDERVIASVETVYVLVDARTLSKVPLPDPLRAALQAGAAGKVTDHAAFL
jgi:acyl-CoA thioester hydrolase